MPIVVEIFFNLIGKLLRLNLLIFMLFGVLNIQLAHAERLKDLTTIEGVRGNQLIGYGLVVGLDGTGDQTIQTPFTVQSIISMMQQMGVGLPPGLNLQLKNVAAAMVTANLPAFAQPGQTLDVTVSSMGNAKSLRGGTLLMTSLKGADGQVYAVAQGNVVVSGAGAAANGTQIQINHLNAGRITAGATVEKAVASNINQSDMINLELKEADFSNASLVVDAINDKFGKNTAFAENGRVIKVRQPTDLAISRVAFLSSLENVNVIPSMSFAKVILNARTGSVVMNQAVSLEPCSVSHGNLSVIINTDQVISQPNVFTTGGVTVTTARSQIEILKEPGMMMKLNSSANLSDVVKALNSIGATPQDLLAILQAMKASGALRAELEII
jgi:flagellar P-ring protein precursor FlgI